MEHQCGCSGEPGPEPTEPIGRPVGVVPTPTPLGETPRAAADGAFLEVSVPRLSVEAAGGTGWSKRSQPFDVAPGAPVLPASRPPALPSFDVAPGAPARAPAWPDEAAVPELAAPLDAPPPAPPAPPPCVRAGCDAHVMRATSIKESFVVAMIRSLRRERTIHLGRYGSLTFAQARQHRGAYARCVTSPIYYRREAVPAAPATPGGEGRAMMCVVARTVARRPSPHLAPPHPATSRNAALGATLLPRSC